MNKMIAIPAKDAIEYGENTNAMFSLLSELRELLMTETRLKKHHRPYLHLREQIDEKVKEIAPVLTKVAVDMLALRCSAVSVEDDVDCAGCICEDCEEDCRMCKDCPAMTVTAKTWRMRKIPSPSPKSSMTSWWRIC